MLPFTFLRNKCKQVKSKNITSLGDILRCIRVGYVEMTHYVETADTLNALMCNEHTQHIFFIFNLLVNRIEFKKSWSSGRQMGYTSDSAWK